MKLITTSAIFGFGALPVCRMVEDSYHGAGLEVQVGFLVRVAGGPIGSFKGRFLYTEDVRYAKDWYRRQADLRVVAREAAANAGIASGPDYLGARLLYTGSVSYMGKCILVYVADLDEPSCGPLLSAGYSGGADCEMTAIEEVVVPWAARLNWV